MINNLWSPVDITQDTHLQRYKLNTKTSIILDTWFYPLTNKFKSIGINLLREVQLNIISITAKVFFAMNIPIKWTNNKIVWSASRDINFLGYSQKTLLKIICLYYHQQIMCLQIRVTVNLQQKRELVKKNNCKGFYMWKNEKSKEWKMKRHSIFNKK